MSQWDIQKTILFLKLLFSKRKHATTEISYTLVVHLFMKAMVFWNKKEVSLGF